MAKVPVQALIAARLRERERLAKVLHDDVTGNLTAAGLQLDLLAMDLPVEFASRIHAVQETLEKSFQSVRDVTLEFHPDPATRYRLAPALAALSQRATAHFTGEFEVEIDPVAAQALSSDDTRACYAVADAALDNVLRHAGARRAWVTLRLNQDASAVTLSVGDDGCGFALDEITPGVGLLLIRHWTTASRCQLSIQSAPGTGAVIRVIFASETVSERTNLNFF